MSRKSFKADAPKKSPWLHARGKKPEKELKPEFPPVTGTFTCPACGTQNGVTTCTQVVVEWPYSKAWFSGVPCHGKVPTSPGAKELRTCGEMLSGWIRVEEATD